LTDTVAAEGLIRLGRWNEAEAILARHATYDTVPLGALRAARAGAMVAARRGDRDRARTLLADASTQAADGMHLSYLDMGAADVHLLLGEWAEAAAAAERGWRANPTGVLLWSARFAMLSVEAAVEQALDAMAARRPIDLNGTIAHLQGRLDEVRNEVDERMEHRPGRDTMAHLAHATASLSRLTTSDPDAWAEAARQWSDLGDRWWTAVARLREAEAAASAGAASRAATALREAHRLAAELGAAPLLGEVEAVSRRTRISIDEPTRVNLDDASISRLGLTPREAEVLTLVSGGRTNRQIGEELFVSEKTAGVHVSNILRKLGVSSRVDAAAVAQRLGA
jgi:DNA-binding CsgD family transcriptional regulator